MKIPKARKLPSGSWFIQLRIGGSSVSITEPTEKLCVAKAAAIKAEYSDLKRPENITLTIAVDNYIKARSNVLSPSTVKGYRVIQRNRFKPLMNKKVLALDKQTCQRAVNAETLQFSPKTVLNSWRFLSSVIFDATGKRIDIRLPQQVPNEHSYLTPEEIKLFVSLVKNTDIEVPALLALHSLRCSELLALRWENVDLKKNLIFVKGALVTGENNVLYYRQENKNASSRRTVPIIIPELKLALESVTDKKEYIVQMSHNTIRKKINALCKENSLPIVAIHGLRHSFASLAYHLNIPEKVAMQIGGWANDQTMRKIYTHISQKDISKEAQRLADFFNNANK